MDHIVKIIHTMYTLIKIHNSFFGAYSCTYLFMKSVFHFGCFDAVCGMYSLKGKLMHYLTFMSGADLLALAIEDDISNVAPGACVSYEWRRKPFFIIHRMAADITFEANIPMSQLRDPETPERRTTKPDYYYDISLIMSLIIIGMCTHLGCVLVFSSGDGLEGFYCPCYGSLDDNVGKAKKGPAPLNLKFPPHKSFILSDTLVLVG